MPTSLHALFSTPHTNASSFSPNRTILPPIPTSPKRIPTSQTPSTMSSKPMRIQVRVMSAYNLTPVNLGGRTSDPYATLTISRTKETHKTSICLNTVNPAWYETMVFNDLHPSDVIQVHISDSSTVTVDKTIGTAKISVGGALSHATAVASECAYQTMPHPSQPDYSSFSHPHSQHPPEPNAPPMENVTQRGNPPPSNPPSSSHPPPSSHPPSYPNATSSYDIPPPPMEELYSQQPHSQQRPSYPSHYPSPSDYHQYKPPQSSHHTSQNGPPPHPPQVPLQTAPPLHSQSSAQNHYPDLSNDGHYTFVPPRITRVDASMQRLMTMNYHVAPRGHITMIIAPEWLPDLEQGAPSKSFKRFQIHKIPDTVGKQSLGSSIGKLIKSGAERAKPLQTALHALQPIHVVFQEHSTWKITLEDVDAVFQGKRHGWNRNYAAAQKIFSGPSSVVTRRMVQMQHAYLYGGGSHIKPVQNMRKELQEITGSLIDGDDFLRLLEHGIRRGKPRLFTYVIMPNRLYLAETGAKFFRDMLSKHAMHCSASAEVVYAGELHFRRKTPGSSEPEFQLIVDNNSGTYAPGKEDLPLVAEVFRRNFPGLHVVALDFQSPLLKQYVSELPPNHSRESGPYVG